VKVQVLSPAPKLQEIKNDKSSFYYWLSSHYSLIWLSYPFWIVLMPNEEFLKTYGAYGDAFGSLNTLFSGLAFFGVMISIFFQNKELSLQREELKDTRKELQGQKEQMKKQNETLSKQTFENTFFKLLNFHNEIKNSIVFHNAKGRKVFDHMSIELSNKFRHNKENSIQSFFSAFSEQDYYFQNILEILKFLDKSSINEKKVYIDLIKAQFSSSELRLIFYFCLSEKGKNLKQLIEKIGLLENLQKPSLLDIWDAFSFDIKAFGENTEWKKVFDGHF
jgi:hypothetical protein